MVNSFEDFCYTGRRKEAVGAGGDFVLFEVLDGRNNHLCPDGNDPGRRRGQGGQNCGWLSAGGVLWTRGKGGLD
jgi:hypothetical protein